MNRYAGKHILWPVVAVAVLAAAAGGATALVSGSGQSAPTGDTALSGTTIQGVSPSTTSPSPAPSSLSPSPITTSPSPSSSSASPSPPVCVTSNAQGICHFGRASAITGASSDPWVGQDVWSPVPGWQQNLYVTSPGDWYAVANMPAGNTAVVSFPNVAADYSRAVSSYSSITSSFNETMNVTSSTVASAAYDMWFSHSGTVNEVMIHHDLANRGGCDTWTATNVQFGGSSGVPVRSDWDLCVSGSTAYWQVPTTGSFQVGSVDILAMVKWLVSHGIMASGSQFNSISYGWEICSTGGKPETFRVNSFSITAS